jgi:hypothetical protein
VTARLVRHLPSFGYEPIVIAAEPVFWDPGDASAYADVAGSPVAVCGNWRQTPEAVAEGAGVCSRTIRKWV